MSMIDAIRKDREVGTPGPWSAFTDDTAPHTNIVSPTPRTTCVFSLAGRDKRHPDIDRVCRVPDMEAALLAAEELVQAVSAQRKNGLKSVSPRTALALAAYRKATGGAA